MQESLNSLEEYLSNFAVARWAFVILASAVITTVVKILFNSFLKNAEKITARTRTSVDDTVVAGAKKTQSWIIFVWLIALATPFLEPTARIEKGIQVLVAIVTGIQVCLWGFGAVHFWRKNILMKKVSEESSSVAAIGLLATTLQAILVAIVILIVLSNLGIDVAALIAGLGVGGIAVALAAQNILGDLLASLSIVLDKPFVIGDFIIVGSEMGTVENIGIKTTRVRSLSGEELVFSNKDLLESRIRNYKRMWRRRIVQKFRVPYSTPQELVEKIPSWIKEAVTQTPNLTFDRAHLSAFGETSFEFEFVFYVENPDFNVYMDLQQQVFQKLLIQFKEAGVQLAVPVRSVQLESVPNPLQLSLNKEDFSTWENSTRPN